MWINDGGGGQGLDCKGETIAISQNRRGAVIHGPINPQRRDVKPGLTWQHSKELSQLPIMTLICHLNSINLICHLNSINQFFSLLEKYLNLYESQSKQKLGRWPCNLGLEQQNTIPYTCFWISVSSLSSKLLCNGAAQVCSINVHLRVSFQQWKK